MRTGPFIAVDWGTTNRRAYRIEGGLVLHSERDDRGVAVIPPGGFPDEAAAIRGRLGDLPMLLAGMAGSNIGWQTVPYVPAPAGLGDLARRVVPVGDRIAIVPGVSCRRQGRADVMRGEEVQLLGAVGAGLVPEAALLCQPGTHCKWAEMRGGALRHFTTAMTGELFALLRSGSLLAGQLTGEVIPGAAFGAGVAEGGKRDLAASLFGIRAAGLMNDLADADAASYASGVLIGADVAARFAETGFDTVHVVADGVLGDLYAAAIALNGRTARRVDSHAAFVAGIAEIWRRYDRSET